MANENKEKKIERIFNKQEEKYNFTDRKLIDYRKKSLKELNKDVKERLNNLDNKKLKTYKITKDRQERKYTAYNYKFLEIQLLEIEKGKDKGKLEYVLINPHSKKIENRILKKSSWTKKEHENYLRNEYTKKGFNFKDYYIEEDTDNAKIEKDKVYYNTYLRASIIIYRLKQGRKYEVIFQAPNNDNYSNWIFSRSIYISFQRSIAIIKEDILRNTGITLEEWIYLSKTSKNIYLEGGISYKRFIGIVGKSEKIDKQYRINFRDL
jgi:hypothetical protein